jgi:hypothetical protein
MEHWFSPKSMIHVEWREELGVFGWSKVSGVAVALMITAIIPPILLAAKYTLSSSCQHNKQFRSADFSLLLPQRRTDWL